MDENEFEKELAKYPVVRPPTWRKNWDDASADQKTTKDTKDITDTDTDTDIDNHASMKQEDAHEYSGEFWDALAQFLSYHFDANAAADILKIFQQNYEESLSSLSLDDIEALSGRL